MSTRLTDARVAKMKYVLTSWIAILCGPSLLWGQEQVVQKTLVHNDLTREYIVYVPSSYSAEEGMPLVLNLHGFEGTGASQMNFFKMNLVAEQEGFLIAYPSAIDGDWSDDIHDTFGDPSGDFNISFIDALLDAMAADFSVDSSRIYSTGYSQGGNLSYILASAFPDRFAAIASVAGTRALSKYLDEPANALFPPLVPAVPDRAFPILHVHGTADIAVPYDGGEIVNGGQTIAVPAVEDVLNEWVANNGCDVPALINDLPNTYPDDNSTVTVFSYKECSTYTTAAGVNNSAEVLLYRVNGGGHSWPLDPAIRPDDPPSWALPINSDFDANSEIWNFFAKHELPVTPDPADCNLDGSLSALDLDCLSTIGERDTVLGALDSIPGDLDGNGDVSFGDFLILSANFGKRPATYAEGNIDLENGVAFADFLDLSSNFGSTSNRLATIPEPDGVSMLVMGLALNLLASRKSRMQTSHVITTGPVQKHV